MREFTPGWYVVQGADAQGRTRLKYFARRDLVTCECYATSDGRQIYVWGAPERPNGMRELWKPSYTFRGTETGGKWDNERTEAKNKASGGGEATATRTTPRSPCEDLSQHCPACDRKGLLIMPLRYAVARSDVPAMSAAPVLSGGFSSGDEGLSLPSNLARYTVRTMRAGYLYVFNEKLGAAGWSGYSVDSRGYLTEFDVESESPPAPNANGNAPCGRRATSEMARCIAIPDGHLPDRLGKIWLAFTDTPWTKRVLEDHKIKPDVREANMRVFDAKAWASSKGAHAQQHVESFEAGHARVAEFVVQESLMERVMRPLNFPWPQGENTLMAGTQPAFTDSFSPFANATTKLPQILEAARQAGKDVPVAMLALADPVGIAIDLNAQAIRRASAWANEPLRRWKRETAQAIDGLEMAVKHGAVERVGASRATTAGVLAFFLPRSSDAVLRGGNPGEKMEYARYVSEEEADVIGREEWQDHHIEYFDDAAKRRYLDVEHPQELKAFEAATLNPLDDAYMAWLKCQRFLNHFRYNFDDANVESGTAYTEKLTLVLADASGRSRVATFLAERLAQDPSEPTSLEVRAMMGNQKKIIDGLVKLVKDENMARGGLSWDDAAGQMWGVFGNALDTKAFRALAEGSAVPSPGSADDRILNAIGRFTYHVSGPIVRRMNNMSNSALGWAATAIPERRLMAIMGAIVRSESPSHRIVDLRNQATRKQATRMIASMVAQISGGNNHQYRSEIRQMLDNIADANGVRYPYRALLIIDEVQAARLANLEGAARDLHLRTSVLVRHEQFESLFNSSVRKVFDVKFKVGIVASIFTAFSLHKALDEMNKASREEKMIKIVNFAGGIAALTGGMLELTEQVLAKTAWGATAHSYHLRIMAAQNTTRASLFGLVGRGLSAIGGLIAGALAIVDGASNAWIAPVYGVTMMFLGLASIICAVLLFTSTLGGVGIILGIVVAIITLVISTLKPTAIQKWLASSYFGTSRRRFEDLSEQHAALAKLNEE